jgi:pimeloyl-ACP methyl ester carboxylesterase
MQVSAHLLRTFRNALAIVAVAGAFLGACGGDTSITDPMDDITIPAFPVSDIIWGECTGDDAPEEPFECATFEVPLDHMVPGDETVSLALVRLPADGDSRGVILTNPGGPGGSGFDFVVNAGETLAQSLDLGDFDLIGFDPRGVDRSDGLRCLSDELMDKYLYVDSTPDTPEEQKLYDEAEEIFEDECEKVYGNKIDYFSTVNTARDMDFIRRGLKQDAIHYIGVSYGTYLGGVYATLFPDHVASMFLDAPFDPQGDTVEESYLTQIKGFEDSFNTWAKWCEQESSCAFTAPDVGARWDALLKQLDDSPFVTDAGREVNNSAMESATIQALYSRSYWPLLATALEQAEQGTGEQILRLADMYNGRNDDGTFSTIEQSGRIIRCASGFGKEPPEDPAALVEQLREIAPRFSSDIEVSDFDRNTCDGLTEGAPLFDIAYDGDAPIVVVGGEKDPATPMRWAEEMVQNLGSNARLVRFSGEGHSQLLTSSCVDSIALAFFSAESELPENDTRCDPDLPVEQPSWWNEVPPATSSEIVLDRNVVGPAVGISDTEIYAEYRAVSLSAPDIYADYVQRLGQAGFEPDDPDATSAVESAQFFSNGSKSMALLIIEGTDLVESQLMQPAGPIPAGSRLVILAFLPDS